MNKKKSVLVTLANSYYLAKAKQLFSSVYWNAGWKGDYLLLAYDISEPDLKWFKDKGIIVKKVESINLKEKDLDERRSICYNKFYIFSEYFKKWDQVVFLDGDIIVRDSLEGFTKKKGFYAAYETSLGGEFLPFKEILKRNKKEGTLIKTYSSLEENYDLLANAFNSGVMVFETSLIKKDTIKKLKNLASKYGDICSLADQPIINLLFYNAWNKLPQFYVNNFWDIDYFTYYHGLSPNKVPGKILHFSSYRKPWKKQSPFYREWKENLKKSELIDLKNRPKPKETFNEEEIHKFMKKLKKKGLKKSIKKIRLRLAVFYLQKLGDKPIGKLGLIIKKFSPKTYNSLRTTIKKTPILGKKIYP